MTTAIKQWLKQQFSELKQVRLCLVDPPDHNLTFVRWHPDLVVYTWTGKAAKCHVISEPPKTRHIRDIARQYTEAGSPVLFVVDLSLLPHLNEVTKPSQWLRAIHALTDGRIYAYSLYGDEPRLYSLHLTPQPIADHFKLVFDSEVTIGDIRFNRIRVRERFIKGNWLIMVLGDGRYWQDGTKRAPFTEEGRRWEPGFTPRADSELVRSYELLGIEPGTKRQVVKAAYRKRAKELHPDTSPLPREEAEQKFRELNKAYDVINDANGWE